MRNHIVLIGDVIQSRSAFAPEKWEEFHKIIHKINHFSHLQLTTPITIYAGDSFGCVCENLSTATNILLLLQEYQCNYQSRIVIVEDEISFGLAEKDFLKLEGKALWESQNAMKEVRKHSTNTLIVLQNSIHSDIVNTITRLILSIRTNWKDIHWTIYNELKRELTQKEIAQNLDVNESYISREIKKVSIKTVIEAEQNLNQITDEFNQ